MKSNNFPPISHMFIVFSGLCRKKIPLGLAEVATALALHRAAAVAWRDAAFPCHGLQFTAGWIL
jgi:hypothetical protein